MTRYPSIGRYPRLLRLSSAFVRPRTCVLNAPRCPYPISCRVRPPAAQGRCRSSTWSSNSSRPHSRGRAAFATRCKATLSVITNTGGQCWIASMAMQGEQIEADRYQTGRGVRRWAGQPGADEWRGSGVIGAQQFALRSHRSSLPFASPGLRVMAGRPLGGALLGELPRRRASPLAGRQEPTSRTEQAPYALLAC